MSKINRPISPFLSVYKPEVTSVFSIVERITGIILVLVIYFVVITVKLTPIFVSYYWFYSISYFIVKGSVAGILLGTLLFFCIIVGYYHVIYGLRYIYWDRVYGKLSIAEVKKTSPILLGVTVALSVLTWFFLIF